MEPGGLPRSATRSPRGDFIALLIVLIVAVVAYVYTFEHKVVLGVDNAGYYLLGEALASGAGYVSLWLPGAPPHNHWPPGYPLIISIIVRFADSIFAVKVANGVFFLGALSLFFRLVRRLGVSLPITTLSCIAAALNVHLLSYSSIMYSEMAFLLFTMGALWITTLLDIKREPYRDPWFWMVIMVSVFAFFIRTIGGALAVGLFLHFVSNKSWKHAGFFLTGFALPATWWILRSHSLGGNSYMTQMLQANIDEPAGGAIGFYDLMHRLGSNLTRYLASEIPLGIFPFLDKLNSPLLLILGIVLAGLTGIGLFWLNKRRVLLAGYLAVTFGILLLWPGVWTGPRFIIAVIPLLTVLILHGLNGIMARILSPKRAWVITPLLLISLSLFINPLIQLHKKSHGDYRTAVKNYYQIIAWAGENTPEGSRIACHFPVYLYLFGNRQGIRYPYTDSEEAVIEYLQDHHIDHVIVDDLIVPTPEHFTGALRAYEDRFETVKQIEFSNTQLLLFLKADDAP